MWNASFIRQSNPPPPQGKEKAMLESYFIWLFGKSLGFTLFGWYWNLCAVLGILTVVRGILEYILTFLTQLERKPEKRK